jgi:hypothetical protein
VLAPERRHRGDLIAAAAIVVVVAALTGVVWFRSDARATSSVVASTPLPPLEAVPTVPGALRQLWAAPSSATTAPVVASGAVVTADGSGVQGRDPTTGEVRWSYRRDLPLCAVAAQWDRAVAVYRDSQGCGQVTSLHGDTGARGPQRSSSADDAVSLSGDGTYLTSVGNTRLETWRSDLVRTQEYGRVDALVSPGAQPRSGCTLRSFGSVPTRSTVVEHCPGDATDRMTLLDPAPSDAARPQQQGSVLLGATGARVLAVTGQSEAVLLPGSAPRVAVYSGSGVLTNEYPVPLTPDDLAGLGDSPVQLGANTGSVITVTVGSTMLALSTTDLALRWSTAGVLGRPTVVAGGLLVPTPGAITELDATTGDLRRTITIDRGTDRGGGDSRVNLAAAGSVVLEQRGSTLVALGS